MSKWIDIKDQVPPANVPVLVYGDSTSGEEMAVYIWAVYSPDARADPLWDITGVAGYDCEIDIEPTHWMPLPEPPNAS